MGYRTYIGRIPRKEYNKIKSLTFDELKEKYPDNVDDDHFDMSPDDFGDELHEFGKYTDFKPPKGSTAKFFKKKEVHEYYNSDYEMLLVTPEFLEYLIGTYQQRIKDYYNDMVQPFHRDSEFVKSQKLRWSDDGSYSEYDYSKLTKEETIALHKTMEHVRHMRSEWVHLTPYDLMNGPEVSTSWKYEYIIFELVRIYKSFDWKKDVMFFYGY